MRFAFGWKTSRTSSRATSGEPLRAASFSFPRFPPIWARLRKKGRDGAYDHRDAISSSSLLRSSAGNVPTYPSSMRTKASSSVMEPSLANRIFRELEAMVQFREKSAKLPMPRARRSRLIPRRSCERDGAKARIDPGNELVLTSRERASDPGGSAFESHPLRPVEGPRPLRSPERRRETLRRSDWRCAKPALSGRRTGGFNLHLARGNKRY